MPTTSNPHAVLLASPGMGHLIPVLELGNRLAAHHGFDVTVFVVAADSSISESSLFRPMSPATKKTPNLVLLPPVDISGLVVPTDSVVTKIAAMMRAAVPSLRAAISAMPSPPTVLVVDMFGTDAMVLAHEFGMLKYVFFTSTTWCLAVTLLVPSLGEKERHSHGVLKEPLEVPGCSPVRYEDTMAIFVDQTDPDLYPVYAQVGVGISTADGILVNTWRELEPLTLNGLRHNKLLGRVTEVPVYPVGPIIRPVGSGSGSEVISWLDKQPKESVVYVSFGSGGTLSAKQTIELAHGLELSQQRFVWVVRPPVDHDVSAAFFDSGNTNWDETPSYLPEGFFTRTKDVGLVVPAWAPQAEILAHGSVGGFMSHCGWNSTLESMVNGVPMIAWPLYAEQKMNATMLVEEVGTTVRLGPTEDGVVVGREEIRDVVTDLIMKGGEIRVRANEVQVQAKETLRKGGSSYNSLTQVAKECERKSHSLSDMAFGA